MKSYFQFSNKQRSGIFLLIVVIISAQLGYRFVDSTKDEIPIDNTELEEFRLEMDSLRQVEIDNTKSKIYPFNPNYITDYKGYTLGMTNEEIDRLHKFREGNKWVNSAKDFQNVTQVSDSLLAVISPYFKFPEWVTNPNPNSNFNSTRGNYSNLNTPKTVDQKVDLNKASATQLQKVYGVGEKLAERIIKYRDKFEGGFASDIELSEVWGLTPEVIERLKNDFTVKTPRPIVRLNLNTATRDQLVTIQYIDYEIANNIIEERLLRDGFKSLEELTKVEDFPIKKIDIIKLYLHL
jgi:competence ComEA-like helix-hairpin-helix protein